MVDGAIWPAPLCLRSTKHKAGDTCLVRCTIPQKLSTTRIVRQDNVCLCVFTFHLERFIGKCADTGELFLLVELLSVNKSLLLLKNYILHGSRFFSSLLKASNMISKPC